MRSPLFALTWEIWRRNAVSVVGAAGLLLACGILFSIFDETIRASEALRFIGYVAMVVSLILVFALFNHTEFNPAKQWTGFPYRHFVLPLPTWLLVAWPMFLGVAAIAAAYLIWARLVFPTLEIRMPLWTTVFLMAGMAGFQTALWSLAAFRVTRILALAVMANALVGIALLPIANGASRPGLGTLLPLAASVPAGFLIAWVCVSRQRHSGGVQRKWLPWLAEKVGDILPRRTAGFASPAAAQFWFEWRRAGWVLPIAVATAVVLVFLPVSWLVRADANYTLWIVGWLFALPLILSAFVGKGFAKPDFWSGELAYPAFLSVRPISSGDLVVIKMKAAALAVTLAWLPVIGFLFAWLLGWADTRRLESLWWLARANVFLWELCAILGLVFVALPILTWRNMVRSLWAGLSGRKPLYVAGFILDAIGFGFLLAGAIWLGESDGRWLKQPCAAVFWIGCALGVGVLVKLLAAARCWKDITPARAGTYSLIWLVGMLCLAALAWLICRDVAGLRYLLVLTALLALPLARIGLSPIALAKNRHR